MYSRKPWVSWRNERPNAKSGRKSDSRLSAFHVTVVSLVTLKPSYSSSVTWGLGQLLVHSYSEFPNRTCLCGKWSLFYESDLVLAFEWHPVWGKRRKESVIYQRLRCARFWAGPVHVEGSKSSSCPEDLQAARGRAIVGEVRAYSAQATGSGACRGWAGG